MVLRRVRSTGRLRTNAISSRGCSTRCRTSATLKISSTVCSTKTSTSNSFVVWGLRLWHPDVASKTPIFSTWIWAPVEPPHYAFGLVRSRVRGPFSMRTVIVRQRREGSCLGRSPEHGAEPVCLGIPHPNLIVGADEYHKLSHVNAVSGKKSQEVSEISIA